MTKWWIPATLPAAIVVACGGVAEAPIETDNREVDTSETADTGGGVACGNGVVEPGEECDQGDANADDGSCTTGCREAYCGDGLVWVGVEVCDDAADPEGCCDCVLHESTPVRSLADSHATLVGEPPRDFAGWSVDFAGDVNGDGIEDILVGAPAHAPGSSTLGAAYVVHGPVTGTVKLASADAKLFGAEARDGSAGWVAGGGDVDGDGLDDIFVSGWSGTQVLYGPIVGGPLADADVFIEPSPGRDLGWVTGPGDVNGDGFDDLLVSQWGDDAYLFFGPIPADADLSKTADARFVGGYSYPAIAGAGDVNNDGFDDLLVEGNESAPISLFYGPVGGDITPMDADVTFLLAAGPSSPAPHFNGAGDVNGDGFDDILISQPSGAASPGVVHLFHGPLAGSIDLASADAILIGEAGDSFGFSVASAGDVNADGFDDIVIGAPDRLPSKDGHHGSVFVYFGPLTGTMEFSDADVTLEGEAAGDSAGFSVAGGGDVDGDGIDDLLVGAPHRTFGPSPGRVYLVRGGCSL